MSRKQPSTKGKWPEPNQKPPSAKENQERHARGGKGEQGRARDHEERARRDKGRGCGQERQRQNSQGRGTGVGAGSALIKPAKLEFSNSE